MKNLFFLLCIIAFTQNSLIGQVINYPSKGTWQLGLGFGEIPMDGSFKPSITFGYHINSKFYAGVIYQFRDQIRRDGSSFNAKSSKLQGLLSSTERVAHRIMAHVRYTPIKNGPYLSGGIVYNGQDIETMQFDDRVRVVHNVEYAGNLSIEQSRPAGWGLALGLGYQYHFKNGVSAGFEWTPAWGQYPTPAYRLDGSSDFTEDTIPRLTSQMNSAFRKSVTNMYKVFHIGLSYRIQ